MTTRLHKLKVSIAMKTALLAGVFALLVFPETGWPDSHLLQKSGFTPISNGDRTGKNWALVIGINYEGRQEELNKVESNRKLLPELKNAINDAKAIKSVLSTYYHYDDARIVLLTDDGDNLPTSQRIRAEITKLSKDVGKDDSLLFFFAGHGFKQSSNVPEGDRVLLLPYDVQFREGEPLPASTLGVPNEFFKLIRNVPCFHKLVILDCCYSGEIFNARGEMDFQPRSPSANRGDMALQAERSFQAIASCRAMQVASDGRDGNSKFTTALLDALKHLPARREGDRRVWANRLLAYISPHFDEFQRPECRSLISSSGEFCLEPRDPDVFKDFILAPSDLIQLRAMVVSHQGSWWFEEMPWFIPAIRAEILSALTNQTNQTRSTDFIDLIRSDALKAIAEKTIKEYKKTRARKTDRKLRVSDSNMPNSCC